MRRRIGRAEGGGGEDDLALLSLVSLFDELILNRRERKKNAMYTEGPSR